MKKMQIWLILGALALSLGGVQAQDTKAQKRVAEAQAKNQVAADKADLIANKEARQADKMRGDRKALKADRKAAMKMEGHLLKDQVKKDVKVVKEKL